MKSRNSINRLKRYNVLKKSWKNVENDYVQ